jgi:CheY-like chemotaxis protein
MLAKTGTEGGPMPKILLVDDMRAFLNLEVSFLQRADCRILTAKDGLEALKKARTEKPDIVLLDIEMPQMNGIECCRILKQDAATKKIPVVIITSTDRKAEAERAGCDDFVKKPITEEQFLQEIKKFIDIRERKEERVAIGLSVLAEINNRKVETYARDISTSGISLLFQDSVKENSVMGLEIFPLQAGGKPIQVQARVVRKISEVIQGEAIKGIGLNFENLQAEDRARIRKLIQSARTR